MKSFKRRRLMVAMASVVAMSVSGSLMANDGEVVSVDIQSQSANEALLELSRVTGAEIIFTQGLNRAIELPALNGEYTLTAALDKLLAGSGMTYEVTAEGLVVIRTDGVNEGDSNEDEVDEEIVVTGSIIRNATPTSKNVSITRDDIDRMGVFSVEDILRRLPQNFAGFNSASSRESSIVGDRSSLFTPDLLGNSAVNLRGLGIGSTLVLLDGRRTASASISEAGFVNLSTIPASSIERIDVLLDGASATYGADAVGGVINIITRKDYVGAETNLRTEQSKNGGDLYTITQSVGTSWEGGRIHAVISREESKAVSSVKADNFTRDYRVFGGRDLRSSGRGSSSPGILLGLNPNAFSGGVALPLDNDGTNWDQSDLSEENARISNDRTLLLDDRTPSTERTSLTLRLDQDLTEDISAFANIIYSRSDNNASDNPLALLYVPETNAFNSYDPDGDGVINPTYVSYGFINEVAAGQIDEAFSDSTAERTDITLGFDFRVSSDWKLSVEGQFSEDTNSAQIFEFQDFQWVTAVNPANGRVVFVDADGGFGPSGFGVPIADRVNNTLGDALASSDPNVAINLFGNGTAQNDLSLLAPTIRFNESPTSDQKRFLAKADGGLFDLDGGQVTAGVGVEYREDSRNYSNSSRRVINPDFDQPDNIGENTLSEVSQDVTSAFVEFNVPLIGDGNAVPGVQSLLMQVSARYDSYDIPDADEGAGATFSNVSPKVGFLWIPTDDIQVRANWSEAFRAPTYNDLIRLVDPLEDCLSNFFACSTVFDPVVGETYQVQVQRGGNPNLKPEVADIYTFGVTWTPSFLPELTVSADYNKTDYMDRISSIFVSDPDFDFASPDLAVRNPDTNRIIYVNQSPVNLSSDISETVDLSVNYAFDTSIGSFDTGVNATHVLTRTEQVSAISDEINRAGTEEGPDHWTVTGNLSWRQGDFGADLFVYWRSSWAQINTGSVFDFDTFTSIPNPPQPVEHYTTIDLTGSYSLQDSGWLFQGGVRDLLDNDYPFTDSNIAPYNLARVDTRGRTIFLNVRKEFQF